MPSLSPNNARRDNARRDNARRDNARRDNARRDNARRDNARRDNARRDNARRDNARRDNARRDNARRDNARRDNARRDNARRDNARRDNARRDNARRDNARRDNARRDNARRDNARRDNARRDNARRDNARRDNARRDNARRDNARRDNARRDNARRDNARREADPLFRREMRERWRRPLTLLQLALFATLLAAIALGFYVNIVPVGTVRIDEALTGSGRQFFRAIARLNALAWIPAGLLLAAPSLAAERERGHLCDWILAGLTPRGIARAKFGALAGFVLVMACVPFPIFALCFPLGGVAPGEFAGALALTAAVAVAATATGLLISAGARRVTEALGGALLMSACLMPIGGVFLVGILAAPPVIIFACAGALALVPAGCFNAACAAFETGVNADLEGDVEAAKAPAPTPQAFEKAMRRPLLLFAPSDAPSAARPSSQSRARLPEGFGEPESALGDLESALVWAASSNAIARREVMAHLRKPRANANANASENISDNVLKTQRWLDFFVLWGALGALGLALKFCWPTSAPYQWFGALVGLGLMAGATLGGASGFTRERAKRMLSALQLTALSPRDIVWGKVLAALLICAQFAAGPLLAVCIMALCYGPGSALMTAILALAGAALSATASLTLSLWGRKTEVVASGALALIAASWILLPQLYIAHGTIFQAPLWLELLWLGPLRVLGAPSGNGALALALSQLAAECALATLALGVLCAWQLQRARAEDEIKSVFQRDLSRSWH